MMQLDITTALTWHLHDNHYPPVSLVFVPVAITAIERANGGDWESSIDMPNGITLSVNEIIDQLHLDFWIEE